LSLFCFPPPSYIQRWVGLCGRLPPPSPPKGKFLLPLDRLFIFTNRRGFVYFLPLPFLFLSQSWARSALSPFSRFFFFSSPFLRGDKVRPLFFPSPFPTQPDKNLFLPATLLSPSEQWGPLSLRLELPTPSSPPFLIFSL